MIFAWRRRLLLPVTGSLEVFHGVRGRRGNSTIIFEGDKAAVQRLCSISGLLRTRRSKRVLRMIPKKGSLPLPITARLSLKFAQAERRPETRERTSDHAKSGHSCSMALLIRTVVVHRTDMRPQLTPEPRSTSRVTRSHLLIVPAISVGGRSRVILTLKHQPGVNSATALRSLGGGLTPASSSPFHSSPRELRHQSRNIGQNRQSSENVDARHWNSQANQTKCKVEFRPLGTISAAESGAPTTYS